MRKVGALALGLVIAFMANFLAMGLAGGGHGWDSPFFASMLLWVAYPFVLIRGLRVFAGGTSSSRVDGSILAAALASNFLLAWLTYSEGVEYFERTLGYGVAELWIAIWLGWQGVAALNLAKAKGYFGKAGSLDPLNEDA